MRDSLSSVTLYLGEIFNEKKYSTDVSIRDLRSRSGKDHHCRWNRWNDCTFSTFVVRQTLQEDPQLSVLSSPCPPSGASPKRNHELIRSARPTSPLEDDFRGLRRAIPSKSFDFLRICPIPVNISTTYSHSFLPNGHNQWTPIRALRCVRCLCGKIEGGI